MESIAKGKDATGKPVNLDMRLFPNTKYGNEVCMPPVHYHLGKFPPEDIRWNLLVPSIGKARGALGSYNGLLSAIPDANLLLSPLTLNEARLSSKIEGTNVTLSEVLEVEAGGESEDMSPEQRNDAEEVLNYRVALQISSLEIAEKGLTEHLMRQAHARLMQGVRGMDKSPGRYRTDQNWIGSPGCTIEEAGFIPVAPEHLVSGMEIWNQYINREDILDPVVQLAISHVEFEALHPFKDGNGRLGRMLIPLFLFKRGILTSPNFYMSGYFETHKEEYLERLRRVSSHNEWTEWCLFFLESVATQAADNEKKARAILHLYEKTRLRAVDVTNSPYSVHFVDFIFHYPVFIIPVLVEKTGIPKPTARRLATTLQQAGILGELRKSSGRRPAVYMFPELLAATER